MIFHNWSQGLSLGSLQQSNQPSFMAAPRWKLQGFLCLNLRIYNLALYSDGQATHQDQPRVKGWRIKPQVSMGEVAKNFQPSPIYHIPPAFGHKHYHMHYLLPPQARNFITLHQLRSSESHHLNQVQVEMKLLGYSSLSMVPLDLKISWSCPLGSWFYSLSHSFFFFSP